MSRDDPNVRVRGAIWPWSEAQDQQLIAAFLAGDKVKVIARALGRPPSAVSTRVDRLREDGRLPYRNRPWTNRESAALLDALDAGARYAELAPIFGRPRQALRVFASAARAARAAAEGADADQYQMELRAA